MHELLRNSFVTKAVYNFTVCVCGMYSMYAQCLPAVLRCQTREVQENSDKCQSDCPSLESSSLQSSLSVSSQFPSLLAHTHTMRFAIDTFPMSARTATVGESKLATIAIITDLQHQGSCSKQSATMSCFATAPLTN